MTYSVTKRAITGLAAAGIAVASLALASKAQDVSTAAATYTADGQMVFPKDFRRWVYLTSGLDMSYVDKPSPGAAIFDNVFVDPAAYEAFVKTGTWPDGTVLALEHRLGEQKGSINKHGHFQTEREGIEVHVKDTTRFKGGWAFFSFPTETPVKMIPQTVTCYACHTAHAAVDTTFVQFYPTLNPIAKAKGTYSAAYLADEAGPKP